MIQDNRLSRTESSSSATLSTINLNQNGPRLNQGLRGERAGTKRLVHGTTFSIKNIYV